MGTGRGKSNTWLQIEEGKENENIGWQSPISSKRWRRTRWDQVRKITDSNKTKAKRWRRKAELEKVTEIGAGCS